jgi:hypothetical protein
MNEETAIAEETLPSFPGGLLNWAGHRSGGVRKPFLARSGRPVGRRLETPLLTRLRGWVQELVEDRDGVPSTLLLVGGPGNGKTDAIESCIEFIDEQVGAAGRIIEAFAKQFGESGALPPRKVVVDLNLLEISLPQRLRTSIVLVQDATERDPESGFSAEKLLRDELADCLDPKNSILYLCCVNRGILAHAATVTDDHDEDSGVAALVTKITRAASSSPESPQCWPLDGYDHIAIWPMDVESLVDSRGDEETVAHQIFGAALDKERWVENCPAGPRCPFCWNRKTLSRRETLNALVRQLRFYELASGKRWTFRDLFSLVPHVLVGDASELRIKDKAFSPCDWAARQLELAGSGSEGSTERAYAPYLLVSRLYHHRLFSRWPALDSGIHRKAKRVLAPDSIHLGVRAARSFFRYLARRSNLKSSGSADIGEILDGPFSNWLDPALSSGGENLLHKSSGEVYTVSEIEELFSLSVREGMDVAKSQLAPIERDLLELLALADDGLTDENFPRNDSASVRLLRGSLRQFSARLTKRSLGVRHGVCQSLPAFTKYSSVLEGGRDLESVRRQMSRLLHGDDNSFSASLVTTFGQPVASRSREIRLLTRKVRVREVRREKTQGRPRDSLPYLQVGETTVPMTFPLFEALEEVDAGLHEASLPAEIFTLLNGVKSLVSGQLVRDESMLEDDARIVFGAAAEKVEILGLNYRIIEAEGK